MSACKHEGATDMVAVSVLEDSILLWLIARLEAEFEHMLVCLEI